ncbi:glycosyltransferase family 39 protein [Actinocrispum wychmicini]|uniref:4-amino-4-deoxy-L-arabinose transferase-like glycosyltransferase n=1 Tax=Actinocrispum wychmicini TaxID=1213861 RepID=A0A4R2IVY2_9PSEU|nr:glycosyltransferase family 39 protein [Actinocrispum wychmicini]TCO48972.1 4-amino-4-deoxy-L-arabinose transferase-like glycosyltransferase [Actinocrispum wychmicini]
MTATLAPPRHDVDTASARDRWVRPSFWALLAATAALYLWDLGSSGYANDFYAAAVQAGTQSWKALFFGSLDAGNAITVDKPPAALWIMGLSGRIFGFSSWSMLVPQALEGVASVALLYAAVKRWSGPVAGLFAGAALALTPVAALMFRFNNPDALLVLLLVAGAYCVVRATETASPKWLMLAGVAVGFGFLTKMLQAFLVLPAFGLVYLVAAPTGLRRRLTHLAAAVGAVIVSAGWYIAVVDLWPADARPYIGGSTDNSILELALGYNGLSRIFGGEGNGGGPGGNGNTAFGGTSGLGRMFGASFGTEISWLLPAALIGLVAGLWFTRRGPRTDRTRAALMLWGGWLLVTALVFSFMQGTVHPYYAVALAPAIAALVAIPVRELWRGRAHPGARMALASMVAVTAMWSFVLLTRTEEWLPALRWILLIGGLLVAALIAWGAARKFMAGLVAAALIAGTAAYGLATAAQPHQGSIPISGPTAAAGFGMRGDGEVSTALVQALRATTERWAAASTGAQGSAGLQLASGKAVMAIGGFTGSDPSPTLQEFQQYVADGQIHYLVTGGMGRGDSDITEWVAAHYTATTIGGRTIYDLTQATVSS